MKLIILIFFPIILCGQQNFVPNPSFENYINCPSNLSDFNQLISWINPTNSTPTFFHSCNTSLAGIPTNYSGFQQTVSGNGYCGIVLFEVSLSNFREYIEVELSSALIANSKYRISFFVSLADSSSYAVNNIGALLTVNQIYENTYYVLNYTPQIINSSSNLLTDVTKWVLIEGTYIASGGERYLTIGNFNNDQNNDTVFIGGPYSAFYYIDDVYVGLDTTVDVSESTLLGKEIKVYPNPTKNIINIEQGNNEQVEILIYDIQGMLCKAGLLKNKLQQIDISDLPQGVYFLKLVSQKSTLVRRIIKE